MKRNAALADALLELGREDLIPLPEAMEAVEVREAVGDPVEWAAVAEALRTLLYAGQVRVYCGEWDDEDPVALLQDEAVRVLGEQSWYSWQDGTGEYSRERVWFVNVDNLVEP